MKTHVIVVETVVGLSRRAGAASRTAPAFFALKQVRKFANGRAAGFERLYFVLIL
jgi:hypothetical protein